VESTLPILFQNQAAMEHTKCSVTKSVTLAC